MQIRIIWASTFLVDKNFNTAFCQYVVMRTRVTVRDNLLLFGESLDFHGISQFLNFIRGQILSQEIALQNWKNLSKLVRCFGVAWDVGRAESGDVNLLED